jgi:hypothetical protein
MVTFMPAPQTPTAWPVAISRIGAVLVGLWIVAATTVLQAGSWLLSDYQLITADRGLHATGWLTISLITAAVVAGPAAVLAAIVRSVRPEATGVRAAARAWFAAGLAAGVLGCVRVVPLPQNELFLLLTAIVAGGLAYLLRRRRRHRNIPDERAPARTTRVTMALFGAAAGLAALLPWLWVGALGGLAETLLAVLAALAVGRFAAGILDPAYFAAFGYTKPRQILGGGFAAGVALLPLASGLGAPAVNLAEMLILPPLGFAAGAIAAAATRQPRGWFVYGPLAVLPRPELGPGAITLLVGIAAAGPVAFLDPEETSEVLGTRDVGYWALVASMVGIAVAVLVGVLYALMLPPLRRAAPEASSDGPSRALRVGAAVTAAVLVAAAGGVYAFAGQPGLHGDRLFVVMKEQADLSGLASITDRTTRRAMTYRRLVETAQRSQAALRRSLDRLHLAYTPYYLVNGILVDGGAAVRIWLSQRSDVDRVLLDQRLRPLPAPAPAARGTAPPPSGGPQWNISLIGADRVWRDFGDTGTGVVIGTSDSGVDGDHPALRGNFRGGADSWYDPWNHTATPTDHNGHGTHTIATAVGADGVGVAPGAQWVGCVNLDRDLGSPTRYLDCLQFMLAPFADGSDPLQDGNPARGPDILTNSWGCPPIEGCDREALRPATAALAAAGLFVVAAAGNSGPECSTVDDPPAPYPDVLTVGAVRRDLSMANFSSRGPTSTGLAKPDLVAPGVDVLSAFPGGTWEVLDGTSMATPHVAGVVALMWSANPALVGDIATTTRLLEQSARHAAESPPGELSTCGPGDIAGAGVVDAYAAVAAAKALR